MDGSSLVDRVTKIKENLSEASRRAGRNKSPQILAISKLQTVETIKTAWEAGLTSFGENYAQELRQKQQVLEDLPIQWHFVGHLQSNKLKDVVGRVRLIHSVDRLELLQKISARAEASQAVLLELNLAEEKSKSGFKLSEINFVLENLAGLKNINVCGLMVMPPLQNKPEDNRKFFAQAREFLARWRNRMPREHPMDQLSMGTSHDYEIATEEGATIVRLGTVLLGERK